MGILHELLRLLDGDEMFTVEEAAARLGVEPSLVKPMLQQLTEGGYLRTSPSTCSVTTACERCPLRSHCQLKPERPIWTLTAKGKASLQRRENRKPDRG